MSHLETIKENTEYDARSVHFSKRKLDGEFEIVARATVEGVVRYVTLDVQPNRASALEAVRYLRGY